VFLFHRVFSLWVFLTLPTFGFAGVNAHEMAQTYYDLALKIADARLAGQICQTNSSRPALIDALAKAINLDRNFVETARHSDVLNQSMGTDLAFRMTVDLISRDSDKALAESFQSVVLYSAGEGIFPSRSFTLKDQGVLEIVVPYLEDVTMKYKKIQGSWSVKQDQTGQIQLSLNYNGYAMAYSMREMDLYQKNIVNFEIESGVGERHLWSFPSECEALHLR
jgi:hypothetical protein